jgi:hypothetical protein
LDSRPFYRHPERLSFDPNGYPGFHAAVFLPEASSFYRSRYLGKKRRHLPLQAAILIRNALPFFAKPHPEVQERHPRSAGGGEVISE